MNKQKEYWNKAITSIDNLKPKYDLWLDKYILLIDSHKDSDIIDLGCGWGDNTLYLIEHGYSVIACDFSEEALKYVRKFVPNAKTLNFDMLNGLPFKAESINNVIADLSLHYFYWDDTVKIVNDIYRILTKDGHLFCRVNSTKDENYNALQGDKIEENYYLIDGCTKRSFDKKSLEYLFKSWKILNIEEYTANKYHKPKVLWEVALSK